MANTKVVELNGSKCSAFPEGSVHKTASCIGKAFGRLIRNAISAQSS